VGRFLRWVASLVGLVGLLWLGGCAAYERGCPGYEGSQKVPKHRLY